MGTATTSMPFRPAEQKLPSHLFQSLLYAGLAAFYSMVT